MSKPYKTKPYVWTNFDNEQITEKDEFLAYIDDDETRIIGVECVHLHDAVGNHDAGGGWVFKVGERWLAVDCEILAEGGVDAQNAEKFVKHLRGKGFIDVCVEVKCWNENDLPARLEQEISGLRKKLSLLESEAAKLKERLA